MQPVNCEAPSRQPKISFITELLWWVLPSSTHKTPNRYHTDIDAIILANLLPYFSPTLLQYFSANTPMDVIAQTKTKFAQILTALTVILEWSIPILGRSFMINSPNGNNQNVWTVWSFKNGRTRRKWGVERTSKSKVLLDLFKLILVGSCNWLLKTFLKAKWCPARQSHRSLF